MFFRDNKYLLRGLLKKNPMVLFVYGILSKFYFMIIAASIIISYFVFSGLKKAGLIKYSENTLVKVILDTKEVAKNCTPIIGKPKEFWNCLSNPSQYSNDDHDQNINDNLEEIMKHIEKIEQDHLENEDPYQKKD